MPRTASAACSLKSSKNALPAVSAAEHDAFESRPGERTLRVRAVVLFGGHHHAEENPVRGAPRIGCRAGRVLLHIGCADPSSSRERCCAISRNSRERCSACRAVPASVLRGIQKLLRALLCGAATACDSFLAASSHCRERLAAVVPCQSCASSRAAALSAAFREGASSRPAMSPRPNTAQTCRHGAHGILLDVALRSTGHPRDLSRAASNAVANFPWHRKWRGTKIRWLACSLLCGLRLGEGRRS